MAPIRPLCRDRVAQLADRAPEPSRAMSATPCQPACSGTRGRLGVLFSSCDNNGFAALC